MKAFLLAAGRGTRISRMIEEIPKCTLPLGDTPLVRYTAKMLLEAGFELVVCVGYKKEKIFKALEGLPVTYYFNPFYEITNSIASLWFARNEIESDIIVMNADVYITRNILAELMEDRHDAVMMIDRTRVKDGDYFFSTTDNGCIVKYGKDLPIQMRSWPRSAMRSPANSASGLTSWWTLPNTISGGKMFCILLPRQRISILWT